MHVEQFVMAYLVEQDRLRALLPEGFSSLRPVLRINAEIRRAKEGRETLYLEFNTPVEGFGKRGWLNIARWSTPENDLSYIRQGSAVTFTVPALTITYTGVGIQGGCPAEQDNDGCFFPGAEMEFRPVEVIGQPKEFCDCAFAWSFSPADAHGKSIGEKTMPAFPTPPRIQYPRQALTAQAAASIPCQQILGAYTVRFRR